MRTSTGLVLAGAILLAAVMVCGTLIALNMRRIYPMTDPVIQTHYLQLLQSGCVDVSAVGGGLAAVSCPIWVRP